MFCYQRSFGLPTEVVTLEQFRALITAPETIRKVKEARDALARGDKNAYDNKAERMENALRTDPDTKFGIAMVDLNNLKEINDDYGHESGDAAIIKLCDIVCAVFAHSQVFRVGGDEFVVILQKSDYEDAQYLIDEFNRKMDDLAADDDLLPQEKASAALGYAAYDPAVDSSVADVLKRADRAMYERKREMKVGRS